MHTIDFSNVEDKYNPFNVKNCYASMIVQLDDNIYDSIIDYALHKDLCISRMQEIEKSSVMSRLLLDFIAEKMADNNIEFSKSSKYFLQSNFMKILLKTGDSLLVLYFQLIGVSRKNKIQLTNVCFLKSDVEYLCMEN